MGFLPFTPSPFHSFSSLPIPASSGNLADGQRAESQGRLVLEVGLWNVRATRERMLRIAQEIARGPQMNSRLELPKNEN